ncbi:MAG: hypothetical protein HYU64_00660 [Armatimonadetes bacterium]|nr:hypothetical protein [Armatimonadota bacterium]
MARIGLFWVGMLFLLAWTTGGAFAEHRVWVESPGVFFSGDPVDIRYVADPGRYVTLIAYEADRGEVLGANLKTPYYDNVLRVKRDYLIKRVLYLASDSPIDPSRIKRLADDPSYFQEFRKDREGVLYDSFGVPFSGFGSVGAFYSYPYGTYQTGIPGAYYPAPGFGISVGSFTYYSGTYGCPPRIVGSPLNPISNPVIPVSPANPAPFVPGAQVTTPNRVPYSFPVTIPVKPGQYPSTGARSQNR